MTITHLSHFGLTKVAETSTNAVFSGTLSACKRMAFSHGMEIDRYEGFIVRSDEAGATYTPATTTDFSRIRFKNGGMIQKARDDYTLVMPLEVWRND